MTSWVGLRVHDSLPRSFVTCNADGKSPAHVALKVNGACTSCEHNLHAPFAPHRVRGERERDEVVLREVARPPFAPAVRTLIRPAPVLRVDVRPVADFRAVTRPPFAPAFRFCAVVPARPPRAPAAFTVIVPRPVVFRAVVLRAVVFRAVVFRAVVFRAVVLRAVVFRAVVFRAVVLRAPVVRREVVALRVEPLLRAVVLRDEVPPREDVERDEPLREPDERAGEPLRDELDERELEPLEPDEDFVSPFCARCLLTVRAAISFARPVERPCFFSESLMCSYWRSRFELHELGIGIEPPTVWGFQAGKHPSRKLRALCAETRTRVTRSVRCARRARSRTAPSTGRRPSCPHRTRR